MRIKEKDLLDIKIIEGIINEKIGGENRGKE